MRKLSAAGTIPAGGVEVELQAGIYELAAAFELGAEDSGTAERPIIYRSRPGAEVRLVGGKVIAGWQPVTDPAVLKRMDPTRARPRAAGRPQGPGRHRPGRDGARPDLGRVGAGPGTVLADQPMTLARWPNEGFVDHPRGLGATPEDVRGTKGCMEGIFTYEGDRPERWVGEKDIMLHGYWFWDWADQRLKVESSTPTQQRITLEPEPQHAFGFRKGMWYYAYNLLAELDQPGEWYLDRESGHPLLLAAGAAGRGQGHDLGAADPRDHEGRLVRHAPRPDLRGQPRHGAVAEQRADHVRDRGLRDPQHRRLGRRA